ncbi:uncharacterized protein PgNI_01692 [Pyricularia grisea]|uniref:Uncharacterized protein n=1 Tax=Pyricularia grisea TaxID=148305 RepID=A0A6P8BL54_PYRGI|nr:uncharacterized protein PgNI_01692 [Pyricularia grisea]TLD17601.1 hypothetical protein PgNI_01692 [Pyricularia grisea]
MLQPCLSLTSCQWRHSTSLPCLWVPINLYSIYLNISQAPVLTWNQNTPHVSGH